MLKFLLSILHFLAVVAKLQSYVLLGGQIVLFQLGGYVGSRQVELPEHLNMNVYDYCHNNFNHILGMNWGIQAVAPYQPQLCYFCSLW